MAKVTYLDHHATTPVDPRVLSAMLPMFSDRFGNPGSVNHAYGWEAAEAVDDARASIAASIGAKPEEIVFTSGATESNNLALRGLTQRQPLRGRHLISVTTEHRAVLDPLARLARRGFEVTLLNVTLLDVAPAGGEEAGLLDVGRLADALRDDTLLVSVMLANNEIGVIQPLAEIGKLCQQRGVLLHCDATQAVGKLAVDVRELQVDFMSFSAHKLYGPKGVGALYVRRRRPRVRLEPQIDGGGQEFGLRSGTLNTPGIVGFAQAVRLSDELREEEAQRLAALRDRLFSGLTSSLDGVTLNGPALAGPALDGPSLRLPGNLNVSFAGVDGEALMMGLKEIAVSSGSACTTANPEPSHVLRALGLSDELTRASLRFGLGRFNTTDDIDLAIEVVVREVRRLRAPPR